MMEFKEGDHFVVQFKCGRRGHDHQVAHVTVDADGALIIINSLAELEEWLTETIREAGQDALSMGQATSACTPDCGRVALALAPVGTPDTVHG
jgi:hypothetical protein